MYWLFSCGKDWRWKSAQCEQTSDEYTMTVLGALALPMTLSAVISERVGRTVGSFFGATGLVPPQATTPTTGTRLANTHTRRTNARTNRRMSASVQSGIQIRLYALAAAGALPERNEGVRLSHGTHLGVVSPIC